MEEQQPGEKATTHHGGWTDYRNNSCALPTSSAPGMAGMGRPAQPPNACPASWRMIIRCRHLHGLAREAPTAHHSHAWPEQTDVELIEPDPSRDVWPQAPHPDSEPRPNVAGIGKHAVGQPITNTLDAAQDSSATHRSPHRRPPARRRPAWRGSPPPDPRQETTQIEGSLSWQVTGSATVVDRSIPQPAFEPGRRPRGCHASGTMHRVGVGTVRSIGGQLFSSRSSAKTSRSAVITTVE